MNGSNKRSTIPSEQKQLRDCCQEVCLCAVCECLRALKMRPGVVLRVKVPFVAISVMYILQSVCV